MSESENKINDEILKLIRLIDRNKPNMFKWYDAFRGLSFAFFAFLYAFIYVWTFVVFSSESIGLKLSIALSFFAFVVGFFALFVRFMEQNIINVNFKRLEKYVEKDEKPLLKALIKIKAMNLEFDLEQIYNRDKSMFKKEKLLERLYE